MAMLALAGCGGDDEEVAKQYATSVDRFCKDVTTSVGRVQSDLSKAQQEVKSQRAAAQAVGGALEDFATGVDSSLDRLRQAEVPSDYRKFHDGATKGLDRVVTALRDAGKSAEQGDLKALGKLGPALQGINVPEPPAELRERAPSCRALSQSQQQSNNG